MNQSIQNELIKIIKEEVEYQLLENEKQSEEYRKASKFHTGFIQRLKLKATDYPNFVVEILKQHIQSEEEIFGREVVGELTPQEKGRIYSLVRCQHMIRVATENSNKAL